MTNFDENLINPDLIRSGLLRVANEICTVEDMTSEVIIVQNALNERKIIRNNDWYPIWLDLTWMERLGLSSSKKIKNIRTNVDWIVKQSGHYFYLTVDNTFCDNPVIPLPYVHNLQEWFYRLQGNNIRLDLSALKHRRT